MLPDEKSHGLGTRRESGKNEMTYFPAILGQGEPCHSETNVSQKEVYLDNSIVARVYTVYVLDLDGLK